MLALVTAMQSGDVPATPALVFSNNPDAEGLKKAAGLSVKTESVDHRPFKGDRAAFEAEIEKILAAHDIDLICLAGFMRILTEPFIRKWEGKMLNIHPSLLPKYKGLNTHQRALDAGDKVAGCSVHIVTPALDDGPLLGQTEVSIAPNETATSLAAKVLEEEHRLYPDMLARFLRQ